MNYELIRLAIAVGATALAAYQDAKTSFIDDKITIAMIALGTLFNALAWNWDFFLFSAGLTAIIFLVGYALYRAGQLGGGDVLLLCGLQALLPLYPRAAMSGVFSAMGVVVPPTLAALSLSVVPFIVSVYLASSFIGVAASGIWYAFKLYKKTRLRRLHPDVLSGGAALALSIALLYWIAVVFGLGAERVAVAFIFLIPSVFLIMFKRDISEKVALKWLRISQMEEEDVIDLSKLPNRLVTEYTLAPVLTKEMEKTLRKIEKEEGIHEFPIQKDLPRFGPYILLGLLVTLLLADPLAAFLFY